MSSPLGLSGALTPYFRMHHEKYVIRRHWTKA